MASSKVTTATLMNLTCTKLLAEYEVFNRQQRIVWRLQEGVLTHLVVEEGYFAALLPRDGELVVLHPPQVCMEGIRVQDRDNLVIRALAKRKH